MRRPGRCRNPTSSPNVEAPAKRRRIARRSSNSKSSGSAREGTVSRNTGASRCSCLSRCRAIASVVRLGARRHGGREGLRRRAARRRAGARRSAVPAFRDLRRLCAAAPGCRILPAAKARDVARRARSGRDRSRCRRTDAASAAGAAAGAGRDQPPARSAAACSRRVSRAIPPRSRRSVRMSGARTGALRADRQVAAIRPRVVSAGRIGGGRPDPHRQRHRPADRGSGAAGARHLRGPRAVCRRK